MRFTENYRLGSVTAGEPLSPLEDSRRMLTIDRQLLGLFEVFGNGIIEGWNLLASSGLTISITPGSGHINFTSAVTTAPVALTVPAGATSYVWATLSNDGSFTRGVDFLLSQSPSAGIVGVYLGSVVSGESFISEVDQAGRTDISFIEAIKSIVAGHRHRGGTNQPSRVDLEREVTGQLPGYRIDGLDASKIVSGIVPPARIPAIEHGDLLHSGVLTHAQLDTFVRDLSNDNTRLLGELGAVNLMQLYLAHKHIWSDVDLYASNMLNLIPGITDDSFTDYDVTTAMVDRFNHTIRGIPATSGRLHTVTLSTEPDFLNAFARVNLDVLTQSSITFMRLTRPVTEVVVEDFDNVFSDDTAFPDWTVTTSNSITAPNNTSFVSDASKREDGVYSARFTIDQQMTVQSARIFDSTQDWTEYNAMEVSVETLTLDHGQIRMQILGKKQPSGAYPVLDDFLMLASNETTKGFKKVQRDITSIDRSKVGGLKVYTDTSLGWNPAVDVIVNVDSIKVVNTVFFDPAGYIRIRMQTPQKSNWAAISWDADDNGGSVSARARTASNYATFDQGTSATFGQAVTEPGGDPGVDDNTSLELELALTANEDRTASPEVRSITISYLTASEEASVDVDSADAFARAESMSNVKVLSYSNDILDNGEENGSVIIDGRIDVGDVTYGLANSVQQATFETTPVPVLGLTGSELFTSPMQAATTGLFNQLVKRRVGIDGAAHVSRLDDRTYLVADTFNDRILLMDTSGKVVRGLVSNNVRNQSDLYPITTILNRRLRSLYVAWSRNVSLDENFDMSKFHLNGTGLSLTLSSQDTASSISGLPGDLGKVSGNVTRISFGTAHWSEIEGYILAQGDGAELFVDIEPDAISEGIDVGNTNFATLSGPRGLPTAITDVIFVSGIYRPISVILSEYSGNWLVANAKPLVLSSGADPVTGTSPEEVTSIIEYVSDTGQATFSSDALDFSTVSLGGIAEYSERYLAIAGITSEEFPPPDVITSATVTQALGKGTIQASSKTSVAIDEGDDGARTTTTVSTEFTEIEKYRGHVRIVEKRSGRVVFDQLTSDGTYGADIQVDEDSNLLVVERFFESDPTSPIPVARGRVTKMDDEGNIYWQYGMGSFEGFTDARLLDNGNVMTSS